jgi:hypothetical protein
MQWFPLKNGRFLLFLSNSWDSSVFFFENDLFWREKQAGMGKFVIQLNFVESFDMLETIGKGSFSKVPLANLGAESASKRLRKIVCCQDHQQEGQE